MAEEVGEDYHDLFVEQGKLIGASWAEASADLGAEASSLGRAKDWCAWTRAGAEAILELPTAKDREQVDHVCRLARAHWRRGGPFVLKAPTGHRGPAWEALRASTLSISAAHLLYASRAW